MTKLSIFKKHSYLVANKCYSSHRRSETVLVDISPLSNVPSPTSSESNISQSELNVSKATSTSKQVIDIPGI